MAKKVTYTGRYVLGSPVVRFPNGKEAIEIDGGGPSAFYLMAAGAGDAPMPVFGKDGLRGVKVSHDKPLILRYDGDRWVEIDEVE